MSSKQFKIYVRYNRKKKDFQQDCENPTRTNDLFSYKVSKSYRIFRNVQESYLDFIGTIKKKSDFQYY